jgi:hypothetical protein
MLNFCKEHVLIDVKKEGLKLKALLHTIYY